MKYTAVTYDNRRYPFSEAMRPAVLEAMAGGTVLDFGMDAVKGSDIRRVEEGAGTGEYGPHLHQPQDVPSIAAEVFKPEYDGFFWAEVLRKNLQAPPGTPWVFSKDVTRNKNL